MPEPDKPGDLDPALRRTNEIELAKLEAQMKQFAGDPGTLDSVYAAAAPIACMLGKVSKAKAYVKKIAATQPRNTAISVCRVYDIKLD